MEATRKTHYSLDDISHSQSSLRDVLKTKIAYNANNSSTICPSAPMSESSSYMNSKSVSGMVDDALPSFPDKLSAALKPTDPKSCS